MGDYFVFASNFCVFENIIHIKLIVNNIFKLNIFKEMSQNNINIMNNDKKQIFRSLHPYIDSDCSSIIYEYVKQKRRTVKTKQIDVDENNHVIKLIDISSIEIIDPIINTIEIAYDETIKLKCKQIFEQLLNNHENKNIQLLKQLEQNFYLFTTQHKIILNCIVHNEYWIKLLFIFCEHTNMDIMVQTK
jgi:hypothetical protein